MKRLDVVHMFAGTLVTLSVVLTYLYGQWWLLLGLFVGLNLFQFSLSKFCPLEWILTKAGMKE